MTRDITYLLRPWPFQPNEIRVRLVRAADGREKIQFRIELGLLEMELHGRPDGERPEGQESWLDYYEAKARRGGRRSLKLAPADCDRLLREGIQFYHRYLSLWHLQRYDLCARDTAHNLRLLEFVRNHVDDAEVQVQFDQWRPYLLMMHARAVATPLEEAGRLKEALDLIDEAIEEIREFLDEYGESERADECGELMSLLQWREELLHHPAGSPTRDDQLNAELADAIRREDYEAAARLRDELRRADGTGESMTTRQEPQDLP